MILSVSRRTDIPRFYFDWFLNRLEAGFVLVRNPMNFHQVSRIELSPQTIDFIVFWSKNPAPMLKKLHLLEPYPYYMQFTINAYDKLIEKNLPDKAELLNTFQQFSDLIGAERMIWRYSPVLLTQKYTPDYHIEFFKKLCQALKGYTKKCNLSFIDMYSKIKCRMAELGISEPDFEQKIYLANEFKKIANQNGIALGACGNLDLEAAKIDKSTCIDGNLIAKLIHKEAVIKKDLNQRNDCYCMPSVDIGTYDTCLNGCEYCYANHAFSKAKRNFDKHNPASPLLFGEITSEDKITLRKQESLFSAQGSLF